MRHPRRAEDETKAQRNRGDGISQKLARHQQRCPAPVNLHGLETSVSKSKSNFENASKATIVPPINNRNALVICTHVVATIPENDVCHHQKADNDQRPVVFKPEQELDQLTRANHLGDQIEADHDQEPSADMARIGRCAGGTT